MPTFITIRWSWPQSRAKPDAFSTSVCGDGILSAALARAGVQHVVALDLDAGVLERAKARHVDGAIEWYAVRGAGLQARLTT